MSSLQAFLSPTYTENTAEVIVSDRFKNEDGTPATVKIRNIMQDENDALIKQSTKKSNVDGQIAETLNKIEYQRRLVLACVVEPNLASEELCKNVGVLDPLLTASKLFTPGEYKLLVNEIMKINNFKSTAELVEEAKN
ncbi:MAG: phage portal protein [Oscillospiraceae bacterium]|jgi:hypothetical protein|nr:phage portal protein [Oscillospiraceae bacterium]